MGSEMHFMVRCKLLAEKGIQILTVQIIIKSVNIKQSIEISTFCFSTHIYERILQMTIRSTQEHRFKLLYIVQMYKYLFV